MPRTGIIVICIMLMMAGTAARSYSEDSLETNDTITVQGYVTAIDWVGSTLMVDEAVFFIPSDVKIIKGADEINFSDIDIGDNVMVTYGKEKNGSLKVVRIAVTYSGEFPI